MKKLERCPFCHSQSSLQLEHEIEPVDPRKTGRWIHCLNCNCYGPVTVHSDEHAVTLWNRRVGS